MYLNEQSAADENQRVTHRRRALATNVMNEAMILVGRETLTDDDARRLDAIFDLLHLLPNARIEVGHEALPLVVKPEGQTRAQSEALGALARMIDGNGAAA